MENGCGQYDASGCIPIEKMETIWKIMEIYNENDLRYIENMLNLAASRLKYMEIYIHIICILYIYIIWNMMENRCKIGGCIPNFGFSKW